MSSVSTYLVAEDFNVDVFEGNGAAAMCETPFPKTLTLSYVEKGSEMSGRPFAEVEMW